jgi:hypothetical protein
LNQHLAIHRQVANPLDAIHEPWKRLPSCFIIEEEEEEEEEEGKYVALIRWARIPQGSTTASHACPDYVTELPMRKQRIRSL